MISTLYIIKRELISSQVKSVKYMADINNVDFPDLYVDGSPCLVPCLTQLLHWKGARTDSTDMQTDSVFDYGNWQKTVRSTRRQKKMYTHIKMVNMCSWRRKLWAAIDCNMCLSQRTRSINFSGTTEKSQVIKLRFKCAFFFKERWCKNKLMPSRNILVKSRNMRWESNYKSRLLRKQRFCDYLFKRYNSVVQIFFYISVLCVSWSNMARLLTSLIKTFRSVFLWRRESNEDYSRFWRLSTDA